MKRFGQKSLNYDIARSPNAPVGKRSHIMVVDPEPEMTLISGLCTIAYYFVHSRAKMKAFYAANQDLIDSLTDTEKEQLRATFRKVLT